MANIKSDNSTDELRIDPISKAARVTMYRSDGTEVLDHVPVSIAVNDVTVVNNDLVASFDASEYSYVSFQLKGTWVGAVRFQASNDNGTFTDIVVQNAGDIVEPYKIEAINNSLVKIPIIAKYLRVRVTSYTSGIIEGVSFAYEHDIHTGQISSTGEVTFAPNSTVGLESGTQQIGHVIIDPNPVAMSTDLYVGLPSDALLNARNIKNAPTTLRSLTFTNLAATPRYLKIYDTAGVPTAGAGAPVLLVSLPAVGTLAFPLPSEGFVFTNGIGMTMTLKPENTDTTNTATVDFSMVSVFHS
tara:strand:+ start:790 stop:1689 length:900 start_codon:yes stop_codon:yes gene_type:complete